MKRFYRNIDICCGLLFAFFGIYSIDFAREHAAHSLLIVGITQIVVAIRKIVSKNEEVNNFLISDDAEKNRKSAKEILAVFPISDKR
ncbi:MAG: hypothetical protein Q4C64_02715 [Erysipelotrichia bacterium]|nr:hypothetical protein [Erysipelotrichia bacterium]